MLGLNILVNFQRVCKWKTKATLTFSTHLQRFWRRASSWWRPWGRRSAKCERPIRTYCSCWTFCVCCVCVRSPLLHIVGCGMREDDGVRAERVGCCGRVASPGRPRARSMPPRLRPNPPPQTPRFWHLNFNRGGDSPALAHSDEIRTKSILQLCNTDGEWGETGERATIDTINLCDAHEGGVRFHTLCSVYTYPFLRAVL